MRILHASDWHLGRLFHNVHLTDDQAYILDDFVRLAADRAPDVVVVAGDLYDRAVPPPEAVELLDEVLSRLVLEVGVPVIAIAGNHDSAERIGFGARLLDAGRLHLVGTVGQMRALTLDDDDGPVDFVPLPFASPEAMRDRCGDDELRGYNQAMARQIELACGSLAPGRRRVAVAHAFVTGGSGSESERPLTVGGAGDVDAALFADFAYTALGHLHRPQTVGGPRVRYSGSLLPYSFSEVDHDKSVAMVEIDGAGEVRTETIALRARRGMRKIVGTLDELIAAAEHDAAREDYLLATLQDTRPVLDAMARLRQVYPNMLHIERPAITEPGALSARGDHRRLSPFDLFADFWAAIHDGEPLADDQREVVADAIAAVVRADQGGGR